MKYTGCIFKTKTKKIVCKELVGPVEGPSEALKCAMRRINGNPVISRFNVNGSKQTTRAHESDGIIDRFVVIGTTGNMIVDRVIKRATHVCIGSRLASIFLLNTANGIHAKRFIRNCLDAM